MDRNFFKYWFKGFEEYLDNTDKKHSMEVTEYCGRACSKSYTKEIYIREYSKANSIEEFLSGLKMAFPKSDFKLIEDDIIEVTYSDCGCDLVTNRFVKTPGLCNCSVQSLKYNFETILKKEVKVELIQSILGGKKSCIFKINV